MSGPRVAVVHPSEDFADCVQYELEQLGVPTTTYVPDGAEDAAGMLEVISLGFEVPILGVQRPDRETWDRLQYLKTALPGCAMLLLTPAPWAFNGWRDRGESIYKEALDLDETVATIANAVRAAFERRAWHTGWTTDLSSRVRPATAAAIEARARSRAARLNSSATRAQLALL